MIRLMRALWALLALVLTSAAQVPATIDVAERVRFGTAETHATLERVLGRPLAKPPALGPSVPLRRVVFPPYIAVQSGYALMGTQLVRESKEWSAGINHYIWHGPCDSLRISDSAIQGASKWASRSYRMRSNNVVERTAFFDTYPEHDLYWNIGGFNGDPKLRGRAAVLFVSLYFEHTAGQNIQFVQVGENRRFEEEFDAVGAGDWSRGGPIIVRDLLSRDAGWLQDGPHVRAAYALSFFESNNDLFVTRAVVDKTMQSRSQGCMLISGLPKAVVRNSAFVATNMAQPLVKVERAREVLFEGCLFQAEQGQNWVEIVGPATVTFRNCFGTAKVNANRNTLGLVIDDRQYVVQ